MTARGREQLETQRKAMGAILRRWRALTGKDKLNHELDEELRFHLERDIDQNIRNGMSAEDAVGYTVENISIRLGP